MNASLIKGTRIIVIASVTNNGVIGRDNKIPWNLPTDLGRFREITERSGLVVMGGETFRSIIKKNGKPLRKRMSIVLSSSLEYDDEEVIIVQSAEELLDLVSQEEMGDVAIIGGESIYRLFAPMADELHLTHVETTVEGDRFFPFDAFGFPEQWEVTHEKMVHSGGDDCPSVYRIYARK